MTNTKGVRQDRYRSDGVSGLDENDFDASDDDVFEREEDEAMSNKERVEIVDLHEKLLNNITKVSARRNSIFK